MSTVKNILFIIPDENKVYQNVNVKIGAFHLPSLAIAILGAIARQNSYNPVVLDLFFYENDEQAILDQIKTLMPEYVAFTCTSATYHLVYEAAMWVKRDYPHLKVLIGGTHASTMVEEVLNTTCFDVVFIGESEVSFDLFLKGTELASIPGIAYKDSAGQIIQSKNTCFLTDLDVFPFPDYSLYDLARYPISKLQARNNPVVWIETSRGCPFNCQVCNKVVHGQTFRPKSPMRVLAEIQHYLSMGVKEFHIADDGFTSNMNRAEAICDLIVEHNLRFTWSCVNGIRVDRVSEALLRKMKQAGCYRISFGIESGDQQVLDNLGKKVTLQQVEAAVKMAKKVGMEVFGFFMFGFENDTDLSMQRTISFAKKLPLDLAKASIIIPFPGSPLYDKYLAQGLIYETGDYRNFNVYQSPRDVYKHPDLDWDTIEKYYRMFYRSFYFNVAYLFRRLIYSIRQGTFWSDLMVGIKMKWV